jgi:hypothetical protein
MAHVQQLTLNFYKYLALTTQLLTQAIEWSNDREQEPFLVPRLALVKVLAIGVPFEDEVMKLLEIEPWLDPDLGLTYLLLPCLERCSVLATTCSLSSTIHTNSRKITGWPSTLVNTKHSLVP